MAPPLERINSQFRVLSLVEDILDGSVWDESRAFVQQSAGTSAAGVCVRSYVLRLHKPQRRDYPLYKQHFLSQVTAFVLYSNP